MKKIYSQPTTRVGAMMSLGFIAGSQGSVIGEDFTGNRDGNGGVDGNLTPGSGNNFGSKDRNFYSGYDSDNDW